MRCKCTSVPCCRSRVIVRGWCTIWTNPYPSYERRSLQTISSLSHRKMCKSCGVTSRNKRELCYSVIVFYKYLLVTLRTSLEYKYETKTPVQFICLNPSKFCLWFNSTCIWTCTCIQGTLYHPQSDGGRSPADIGHETGAEREEV